MIKAAHRFSSMIAGSDFTYLRQGRKETFYLMIHSTHFIYGYMAPNKWIRKPTPFYNLGLEERDFYMPHPTDRIAHTTALVIPVMENWLIREIERWVQHGTKEEGNVLFNDALNTFYLRLYGKGPLR